MKRAAAICFGLAVVANLTAVALGSRAGEWATKPLLIPLLALLAASLGAAASRTGRLLLAALAAAWAADVALLIEGDVAFLVGMGLFGLMQLGYLWVFARLGAVAKLRRRAAIPALYGVLWLGANLVLHSGLSELAVPVAIYSLLLCAMAAFAAGLGLRAGLGGALFLISDLMIGLGAAGTSFPLQGPAIMATYTAAQLLLALSVLEVADDESQAS